MGDTRELGGHEWLGFLVRFPGISEGLGPSGFNISKSFVTPTSLIEKLPTYRTAAVVMKSSHEVHLATLCHAQYQLRAEAL